MLRGWLQSFTDVQKQCTHKTQSQYQTKRNHDFYAHLLSSELDGDAWGNTNSVSSWCLTHPSPTNTQTHFILWGLAITELHRQAHQLVTWALKIISPLSHNSSLAFFLSLHSLPLLLCLKDRTSWFISQTLTTRHCYYGDPILQPAPGSVCCRSLSLLHHLPISLRFTSMGQRRTDMILLLTLSLSFDLTIPQPRLQCGITNQALSWMPSYVFHLPLSSSLEDLQKAAYMAITFSFSKDFKSILFV